MKGKSKSSCGTKTYARGGKARVNKNLRDEEARVIARQDDAADEMRRLRRKAGREEMGMMGGGMARRYAKGGSVTRADGVCKKGHTKGRMV
jgi:hypothetical protein